MDRKELLRKLVTKLHLNVPERRALAGPVEASEVISLVVEILVENGSFPPGARPWKSGEPCGDGTILEVLPTGAVRAHLQVSTAWMTPEHLSSRDFPDAKSAAIHLVRTEYEKGIDGISFVWPGTD